MYRPLICMAVLAGPLLAQTRLHVAGTVRAGETFRKEFGRGLTLVLAPNDSQDDSGDSGWTIEVQPADQSDNFIRCVIEPIHGPTQADLLASQFVSEENEKLPEPELSEQKKREFPFTLNSADQKKSVRRTGRGGVYAAEDRQGWHHRHGYTGVQGASVG